MLKLNKRLATCALVFAFASNPASAQKYWHFYGAAEDIEAPKKTQKVSPNLQEPGKMPIRDYDFKTPTQKASPPLNLQFRKKMDRATA